MTAGVLVALRGDRELAVVGAIDAAEDLAVVRRCADNAELLASAMAGLGAVAVVDAELEPDRSLVARLAQAGTRALIMCPPAEAPRYRAMSAQPLPYQISVDQVVTAVQAAAAAPVDDPGWLGLRSGSGANESDLIDTHPNGIHQLTKVGQMLLVGGAGGSPGRSTIALNLAAELAVANHRTLLIDADIWGAAIAPALGLLQESAGLAAAVRAADRGTLDPDTLSGLCRPISGRLSVLPGLPRPSRWREVSGVGIDEVWRQARLLADWVIVDAPVWVPDDDQSGGFDAITPQRNAVLFSLMAAAEHSLMVGAAEPTGIQRLVQTIIDADERHPPSGRRVVVNRLRAEAAGPRPAESVREALHRFAGVSGTYLVPDDRLACDRAALMGLTLAETAPHSPAREAIAALAHDLGGLANGRRLRRRRRR
ncbi:MAG: CpaE family protein [Beutenbergiaceae bacterium]